MSTSIKSVSLAIVLSGDDKDNTVQNELHALAQRFKFPICGAPNTPPCDAFHFMLSFIESDMENRILALSSNEDDFEGNVHIDFVHGKVGHRRQFGGGRGQSLPKAIGMKHGANPTVIDATAGLGRDAFVLASLGARVTMVERSPVLAALLEDGLKRLAADPELAEIAQSHLKLVHANAIEWLQQQAKDDSKRPDVVYLDPMYPHRTKTALVKKEMRALRELVGDDDDAAQLLNAARRCATKRVVVKRPKGAPLLDDSQPSGNVQSKNTRYDIYSVFAKN